MKRENDYDCKFLKYLEFFLFCKITLNSLKLYLIYLNKNDKWKFQNLYKIFNFYY